MYYQLKAMVVNDTIKNLLFYSNLKIKALS